MKVAKGTSWERRRATRIVADMQAQQEAVRSVQGVRYFKSGKYKIEEYEKVGVPNKKNISINRQNLRFDGRKCNVY